MLLKPTSTRMSSCIHCSCKSQRVVSLPSPSNGTSSSLCNVMLISFFHPIIKSNLLSADVSHVKDISHNVKKHFEISSILMSRGFIMLLQMEATSNIHPFRLQETSTLTHMKQCARKTHTHRFVHVSSFSLVNPLRTDAMRQINTILHTHLCKFCIPYINSKLGNFFQIIV